MCAAMGQAQSAPVVSLCHPHWCGQRLAETPAHCLPWQQRDGFDGHANVAGNQFTVCRPMAERHLSVAPLTLLPPIVAITPSNSPKPLRWRCSTESLGAGLNGRHTHERPRLLWAELFCNQGLKGLAGKRHCQVQVQGSKASQHRCSVFIPPI